MNCPICGNGMEPGTVATNYSRGLFFLPPGGKSDFFIVTNKGIERQGGIVLDGPYNSTLHNETSLSAHVCRACRKIVMDY